MSAMVLGATGGIGQAFVHQLAARRDGLILVARNRGPLEALAERVRTTYGVAVEVLPADLAQDAGVGRVEDRIRADTALELLVNSAGIASWGRFTALDLQRELDVIHVNVMAAVRLTRAAVDSMRPRGHGAIVNLASLGGFIPLGFAATYGATKAFLISFTEALYEELRGTGVRIQVVCPGLTPTDLFARAGADVSKIPSALLVPAETTARCSLAALERDRPVCIPGARVRLLSMLLRLLPRGGVRRRTARRFGSFETYRLDRRP